MVLIGGGAGSGKTLLAGQIAQLLPDCRLICTDDYFFTDGTRGAYLRGYVKPGRYLDFGDPESIDQERLWADVEAETREGGVVVLEGLTL